MLEANPKTLQFLAGGGEMGTLIREYNWASTPLGPINTWPQSLRTMVDVILHSEVPMFLWWGPQLIQFYNDAYRPSLGLHGKHPTALGQRGEECWPEIWPIIKPLIDRVREGGATWSEDQLIPIYRNGRIEDVYWTFGYSPVRDEAGAVAGILVVCNETTRQIKALKRIEESEEMLRSIVLHAPVGMCIIREHSFTVEVVNDLYLELVGKSRDELEGKPFFEALPETRSLYGAIFEKVADTLVSYQRREEPVTVVRRGKEEVRYVDFVVETISREGSAEGRKAMILAIDVTDKVLARKKVEESETRYKMLITESTVAIALYTGPELRIQYVNEIMTGYWGKDMGIIGLPLAEAVPELIGQSFIHKLQTVYETGETYRGTEEEAWLKIDGKLQASYFNFVYKALRNTDGTIYGVHHMAMEVSERVRARKRVERSEANLRNIILKAPVAMCILRGPEFIVEIANERMFALWGRERDELINQPIFKGLPEVRDQGFEELLEGVYETGKTFTAFAVPTNLPRNGGVETVHTNFLYEPFRDPEGAITGVIVVAIDVTEQVKARHKIEKLVEERTRELKESNANLRRSNEELAQFAYVASHDLQEPARKVSTFIEMLQQIVESSDPRVRNLIDKIDKAAARSLFLIRDILTYSQLAKKDQQAVNVDLNEVLATVRSDFELLIEEKQAIIFADALPVVTGIPTQMNQLFANLISNALKFSHDGRPPVIRIDCTRVTAANLPTSMDLKEATSYHHISISDNGIGFGQAHAFQIFDIFQRLHTKSAYEGTGIGLAICKKIARNHNGDIWAESTEGVGTTFHVLLPADPAQGTPDELSVSSH